MIKNILLSIFLLNLAACSKQMMPVVGRNEGHVVAPSNGNIKMTGERGEKILSAEPMQKLAARRLTSAKPKLIPSSPPRAKGASLTIRPAINSFTISRPVEQIMPLYGRKAVWSINPDKYISRDVVDCPKNRIDSFCMGRDYKVIQKIFGWPTKATHYTWSYNNMNVKYLAGGGRHSIVNIGFINGKVCRVTTAP